MLTTPRSIFLDKVNSLLIRNGYESIDWKDVRYAYESNLTPLLTAQKYIDEYA